MIIIKEKCLITRMTATRILQINYKTVVLRKHFDTKINEDILQNEENVFTLVGLQQHR